jgi:septum site-determining protein MinC
MITIKGLREGLLIILGDGTWHEQLRELESKLVVSANFFKGGRVALDVKSMALSREDIERARALLAGFDVQLWAVLSHSAETNRVSAALGLEHALPGSAAPRARNGGSSSDRGADAPNRPDQAEPGAPAEPASGPEHADEGTDGVMVRRRVRSGQVIRHPGHIVVLGDVNPGAQLIAGGDIIVWGKLQGSAHAGALGDASAVVGALALHPSTLRIADTQLIQPASDRRRVKGASQARLGDAGIDITAWQEK